MTEIAPGWGIAVNLFFFTGGGPAMAVLGLLSVSIFAMAFFLLLQFGRRNHPGSLHQMLRSQGPGSQAVRNGIFLEKTRQVRFAIQWLSRLANLSTLTGLLGTVIGIRTSFLDLEQAGKTGPEILASGIHQAVSTTIVGLFLAILALTIHYYFRDRFTALREEFLAGNSEGNHG